MTKPEIVQELRRLRTAKRKLVPETVVNAARDDSSPLHNYFEWDDSIAGHKFRLWQARMLIANVTIVRDEKAERTIPVFVSLMSDRTEAGGGYRTLIDVLADPEQRKELLRTASAELEAFEQRYRDFEELAGVFAEAHKVARRVSRHARRKVPA